MWGLDYTYTYIYIIPEYGRVVCCHRCESDHHRSIPATSDCNRFISSFADMSLLEGNERRPRLILGWTIGILAVLFPMRIWNGFMTFFCCRPLKSERKGAKRHFEVTSRDGCQVKTSNLLPSVISTSSKLVDARCMSSTHCLAWRLANQVHFSTRRFHSCASVSPCIYRHQSLHERTDGCLWEMIGTTIWRINTVTFWIRT